MAGNGIGDKFKEFVYSEDAEGKILVGVAILLLITGCVVLSPLQSINWLPEEQNATSGTNGTTPGGVPPANVTPPPITPPPTPPVNITPGGGSKDEFTLCVESCNSQPPQNKDNCMNSCRVRMARQKLDTFYCKDVTRVELKTACYSMIAMEKKDRGVCAQAPDIITKTGCEMMYDSSQRPS